MQNPIKWGNKSRTGRWRKAAIVGWILFFVVCAAYMCLKAQASIPPEERQMEFDLNDLQYDGPLPEKVLEYNGNIEESLADAYYLGYRDGYSLGFYTGKKDAPVPVITVEEFEDLVRKCGGHDG